MQFISTRGKSSAANAAEAISKGIADDGGLFVPVSFPDLSEKLADMADMNYADRAALVIGSFLTEYDKRELLSACVKAYGQFEDGDAAPLVKTDDGMFILELFHGPTLAFKDIALTLLPYLLRAGSDIYGVKEEILILTATSGDTGKAALEGFKDREGVKIMVFYPSEGVSDMQKLQMSTQEGKNVRVLAVSGNFDDCQTAVKKAFADAELKAALKKEGVVTSSANSINFGRLVPQIAYYFSSYADLLSSGEIAAGEKVNFVVPTGNFGNILAGYYAKRMGLPVNKLICASNSNNVLTDFFGTGTYTARRKFYKTMSPSMDILISSNLERLIFEFSWRDAALTEKRMAELREKGVYSVSEQELGAMKEIFYADCCGEEECLDSISEFFEGYGYVADPHTAVAVNAMYKYKERYKDDRCCIVVSTASPYKFPSSVYFALTGKEEADAFRAADMLYKHTAYPVPQQILSLKKKTPRFTEVISGKDVEKAVLSFAAEK